MTINNHFDTASQQKFGRLLRSQADRPSAITADDIHLYARTLARIENALVVVSDLRNGTSRIFAGELARSLGLDDYKSENSIWETKILSLMSEHEREEKVIAELRFFHYLRHLPAQKRRHHFLMAKLRFNNSMDVLHRMYYIFDETAQSILYAVCIYSPLSFDFAGNSFAVNSLTGIREELTSTANNAVISKRERQILQLIASGKKSIEIAEILSISKNTVSRHRQEILAKLQVKNSIEACRLATRMGLI